jgi:hypothetical protein
MQLRKKGTGSKRLIVYLGLDVFVGGDEYLTVVILTMVTKYWRITQRKICSHTNRPQSAYDTYFHSEIFKLWYDLINSMEQSLSWKANSLSATQEILRHLWNPKLHYRFQKSPSLVPIMGQTDLLCTFLPYFFNIHFNIILQSTSSSSKWSLS